MSSLHPSAEICAIQAVERGALISVDRAISELRRGGQVIIRAADGSAARMIAAEAATSDRLDRLADDNQKMPRVAITGRRASVLHLISDPPPVVLMDASPLTPRQVAILADPLIPDDLDSSVHIVDDPLPAWGEGAVQLVKLARLLPAAVVVEIMAEESTLFSVEADDVMAYQQIAARALQRVAEARVPLADAEDAKVIAFRPSDGGIEHLAIVIGQLDREKPVLTRLHSECFTGDILGSLRCDCGQQLRGAIAEISRTGGGILLYLAQEGRGIGLVNKLRAYELQDRGFDTLDANEQLGFDDDERIYLPAAEMLRLLDVTRVRLMTNNPAKVQGLARHGIAVTERVPHIFPSNGHNEYYLQTKATRSGHLF